MSSQQTPEEVLKENIEAMGPRLGLVFTKLKDELVWLHWRWDEFVELYGTNDERIAILNDSAPMFFSMIQRIMWRDLILGISHFVAPPRSRGKPNLTLKILPDLVIDSGLKDDLGNLLDDLEERARFAVDWRKRWIAHKDLGIALDEASEPLAPATRKAAAHCLEGCTKVLDAVQSFYKDSTTAYTMGHTSRGAEHLLYVIRDGLRREEDRERMLDQGGYDARLFNDDLGAV